MLLEFISNSVVRKDSLSGSQIGKFGFKGVIMISSPARDITTSPEEVRAAIFNPSGDQAGLSIKLNALVNFVAGPPSAATVQMVVVSFIKDTRAMVEPSGDHAGE